MRLRILAAFLLGVVVGMALYAVFRGDLTPVHPAFEHAAGTTRSSGP